MSSEPVYEATVHPDLALLLQGKSFGVAGDRSRARGPNQGGAAGRDDQALPGPAFGGAPPRQYAGAFGTVLLRRDGDRPIRAEAALVWDVASRVDDTREADKSLDRRIRLFLRPDGQILAQIAYTPGEGCAARPVVVAEALATEEALSDLLAATPPEACFAVGEALDPTARALCARLKAIPAIHPSLAAQTATA